MASNTTRGGRGRSFIHCCSRMRLSAKQLLTDRNNRLILMMLAQQDTPNLPNNQEMRATVRLPLRSYRETQMAANPSIRIAMTSMNCQRCLHYCNTFTGRSRSWSAKCQSKLIRKALTLCSNGAIRNNGRRRGRNWDFRLLPRVPKLQTGGTVERLSWLRRKSILGSLKQRLSLLIGGIQNGRV